MAMHNDWQKRRAFQEIIDKAAEFGVAAAKLKDAKAEYQTLENELHGLALKWADKLSRKGRTMGTNYYLVNGEENEDDLGVHIGKASGRGTGRGLSFAWAIDPQTLAARVAETEIEYCSGYPVPKCGFPVIMGNKEMTYIEFKEKVLSKIQENDYGSIGREFG